MPKTLFEKSLYCQNVLAVGKSGSINCRVLILSLIWDNMTDIYLNIFGRLWSSNTISKYTWTCWVKWNYSPVSNNCLVKSFSFGRKVAPILERKKRLYIYVDVILEYFYKKNDFIKDRVIWNVGRPSIKHYRKNIFPIIISLVLYCAIVFIWLLVFTKFYWSTFRILILRGWQEQGQVGCSDRKNFCGANPF